MSKTKSLGCRLAILLIAGLFLVGCFDRLSQASFNKVQKGMTFEEVVAILGQPTDSKSVGVGPLSATSSKWSNAKIEINIKFVNNKVQLKSLDTKSGPS
jgi:hypothetical protein